MLGETSVIVLPQGFNHSLPNSVRYARWLVIFQIDSCCGLASEGSWAPPAAGFWPQVGWGRELSWLSRKSSIPALQESPGVSAAHPQLTGSPQNPPEILPHGYLQSQSHFWQKPYLWGTHSKQPVCKSIWYPFLPACLLWKCFGLGTALLLVRCLPCCLSCWSGMKLSLNTNIQGGQHSGQLHGLCWLHSYMCK